MNVDLRARGVRLDTRLRDVIDRKLRFGLARFDRAIGRVSVTIADVNGPKGGEDKLCRVRLVTAAGPPIVIEEVDSVTERAVGAAVDRAARNVARRLHRGTRHR